MALYPDQPLAPLDPGLSDYLSRAGAGGYSSGGSVARALPPTRQSLWNTVYGPTPPTYSYLYGRRTPTYADPWAEGAWTHDPHSNPSLAPATEDDRMLAYGDQAHQLAQEVYKRGTADQSERRIKMLQSLLQSGASPNLYSAPMNAGEADLQNFIQQDYNAGVRGWRLIPTADQIRQRQKENLALARQREQLGLDQAKFIVSNRRNAQNDRFNQAIDRARLAQTAGNESSNLALRRAELAQRGQESDMRAQDALDREQMLADRQNQMEALQAVRAGMDPETAADRYGINGTGRDVLKSWGQLGSERGQDAADALNQTELSLRQLASDRAHGGAVSAVPSGWFSSGQPEVPASEDRHVLSELSPKQLASLEAQAARNRLRYDPLLGFYPSGTNPNQYSEDEFWATQGLGDADLGQSFNPAPRQPQARLAPDQISNLGDAHIAPRARPARASDGLPIIYSLYDQAYANMRSGEIGYDGRTGKPFRKP